MNTLGIGAGDTERPDMTSAFRMGCFLANVWLLFLVFPIISVASDDDLSQSRKIVAISLLALFALTHFVAYIGNIRRELDLDTAPPDRSVAWFIVLVAICCAAFVAGSWPILAVAPFIVSFAVFNFGWRAAGLVCGVCLAIVVIVPALGGVLGQAWFFSVLVVSVGGAAAMTRMNQQSQDEQSMLLTQLAVGDERDRVARDVHDVLGHSLTVVILKTQICDRLMGSLDTRGADGPTGPTDELVAAVAQTRSQLAEIESVSRRALAEIRATVGGLRTADLGDELAAARVVLADAGVELTVRGDSNNVPLEHRSLAAWVVRESVTNVIRHARATQCTIELAPAEVSNGTQVVLRICDNGVGLGSSTPGNGLVGLQERAHAAGVALHVASDDGTVIEVATSPHEISI